MKSVGEVEECRGDLVSCHVSSLNDIVILVKAFQILGLL